MPIAPSPTNVILQARSTQTLLTWDSAVGASSYDIARSTDGVNFASVGTSTSNQFIDSTVLNGTEYYYRVASVNVSGTSSYQSSYPPSITPCLPGQINLGYLRYMSQLRADKLNSFYLTKDEWNFNINQSSTSLYDLLTTKFGEDYFFAPPVLIPVTGAQYYPLPDGSNYSQAPACYKLSQVSLNYGGNPTGIDTGWITLARFNLSDYNRYTPFLGLPASVYAGVRVAYRVLGNNLYILPVSLNGTLRLFYVPVMTPMLLDTDMLPFSISGWSEYVINDAAMKAMVKEESSEKYQLLAVAQTQLLDRIESAAANRDVGQVNSVSNVRATAGDPGLSTWGSGMAYGGFGYPGGW